MRKRKQRPTALGVYIFAGGFTLGVQKHFAVLGHLEDGPFGVATVRKNLPGLDVYEDPETWPIEDLAGRVDFLYANPPCAPWSLAGSRANRLPWQRDPRTSCWRKTAETIFKLRPKVAAIESVRPLYTRGREMLVEIAAEARQNGYQALALLEDAIDCNMAQKRPRFMLVLTRYQYQASPTEGKDVTPREVLKAYYDVAGRPTSKNSKEGNHRYAAASITGNLEGKLLKHTKPGERMSRVFDRLNPNAKQVDGKMKGRPSMLKYRLHPDQPSKTQPGGAILFHHKEDRYLTIGEAAALCSYPAGYEFAGSISSAYAQIGKAVMPNVGEHVALDARRTIERAEQLDKKELQKSHEITVYRDRVEQREIDWTTPEPKLEAPPFTPDPPKRPTKDRLTKDELSRLRRNSSVVIANPRPRTGIGGYMRQLIIGGKSDAQVLDLAKKKFPASKATIADVRWNRGHLRPGGKFHHEVPVTNTTNKRKRA